MQTIYTAFQQPILVDDEDFLFLNRYTWCIGNRGYPASNKNRTGILMHLLIAERHNIFQGVDIDHKDRDKLNNQKNNFRAATRSQNMANVGLCCTNSSGYKGVHWYSRKRKFQAKIKYQYRTIHLGYFDSVIEAARAYDLAARKFFGQFACYNFEG